MAFYVVYCPIYVNKTLHNLKRNNADDYNLFCGYKLMRYLFIRKIFNGTLLRIVCCCEWIQIKFPLSILHFYLLIFTTVAREQYSGADWRFFRPGGVCGTQPAHKPQIIDAHGVKFCSKTQNSICVRKTRGSSTLPPPYLSTKSMHIQISTKYSIY